VGNPKIGGVELPTLDGPLADLAVRAVAGSRPMNTREAA